MAIAEGFTSFWSALKLILMYGWPFILLIVLFIARMRWKKYPIEAVIIEQRGDNLIETNDRVGKFIDAGSDMTFYKLKKTKDSIPVYNYDWVLHNRVVPTNLLERLINILQGSMGTIFLYRYGSKQYKPINITNGSGTKQQLVASKDKEGNPIYTWQYAQFDPRWVLGTLDFEVIDWDNMNFMVQEQRASTIRRQKKGEFWKQTLIPVMIIAASVLVALFILKFSFDAGRDLRAGTNVQQETNGDGGKLIGSIGDSLTPGA